MDFYIREIENSLMKESPDIYNKKTEIGHFVEIFWKCFPHEVNLTFFKKHKKGNG